MTDLAKNGDLQAISPERMTLSRNETESLCLKAARGAGFSWGMAEEAGFAAGWICAQGIDGVTPLLGMLTRKLGRSAGIRAPHMTGEHWYSVDLCPLCPIQLGAALTDRAALPDGPFSQDMRLDPVETPLLLLPFLVRVAQICQKSMTIEWQGGRLSIRPEGDYDGLDIVAWTNPNALAMKVTMSLNVKVKSAVARPGHLPSLLVSTVNGLGALALRTTVPATNASRSGAGSTTTDND